MGDLLNQALTHGLDEWLDTLLVIGLKAASLPPETKLEDLLAMKTPKANVNSNPSCGEQVAQVRCCENSLFGSLLLATKIAGTQRAEQICDCLQGLIWHDAVVLGDAISYFQDLAASDCIDDEAWLRQDKAEDQWAPWDVADKEARKALDDFLYDYCDTQFIYQHDG